MSETPNGIYEAMWQLFKDGPTWDGNLIDKTARNWMVSNGYAFRCGGYNSLTEDGVEMAISLEMGTKKDGVPT